MGKDGTNRSKSHSVKRDKKNKKKRRRKYNNAAAVNISNKQNKSYEIFASTVPGLEQILSDELETKIQISKKNNQRIKEGGVLFTISSVEELYKCHLHLGSASHLFLRASLPVQDDANVDDCSDERTIKGGKTKKTSSTTASFPTTTTFRATRMRQLIQKVSQMEIWKDIIPVGNSDNSSATSSSCNYLIPKLDIRVSTSKSKLYHTQGIAERVKMGIYKALGYVKTNGRENERIRIREEVEREVDKLFGKNSISNNDSKKGENAIQSNENEKNNDDERRIRVLVRIERDEVEISLDTSLTPLHRRGYKLDVCKAPLREDIAFGFLYSLGWPVSINSSRASLHSDLTVPPPSSPSQFQKHLIDPFCGSGTILIEGANMAMGFPPGRLRPPPCEFTSLYNENLWNQMIQSAMDDARGNINRTLLKEKEEQQELPLIFGGDRDAGAISATIANAKRAGVDKFIEVGNFALRSNPWMDPDSQQNNQQTDITCIPKEILIATNPPFGIRISSSKKGKASEDNQSGIRNDHHLLNLYQTFGMMVQKLKGSEDDNLAVNKHEFQRDVHVGLVAHDVSLARRTGISMKCMFGTKLGGASISVLKSESAGEK